jgi:predicted small lipoprotein YifL
MKKISLSLFLTILTFSFALVTAGCGKNGPPASPAGSKYNYPHPYPSEE